MTTRAANDFLVVGMVGLGTALFLTQLLIVSQQIVTAHNRIQAELNAEKSAVPIDWIDAVRPPRLYEDLHWGIEPPPSTARMHVIYPPRARELHIGGYVEFDLMINPDGSIARSKVVAEFPRGYGFADAAVKALSNWRFAPPKPPKSKPTPSHFRMTFKPDD